MLTKIAQNNPSWFKASKPEFSIASSDNKTRSLFYEYGTTGNLVHDFILEPGVTYSMFFGRVGSVGDSFNQPKESITGTYGPFTFNSQKYQGQLNYMTPTLSADKSVQIQPSIGLWTNETTNNNLYVPFTVNKPTRITSFTYNHPKKMAHRCRQILPQEHIHPLLRSICSAILVLKLLKPLTAVLF